MTKKNMRSHSPSFLICHRGALGDFILTWPALHTLKKILPEFNDLASMPSGAAANFAQSELNRLLSEGVVRKGEIPPMIKMDIASKVIGGAPFEQVAQLMTAALNPPEAGAVIGPGTIFNTIANTRKEEI